MKRESKFEVSADYQLPPGELWWLLSFTEEIGPNFVFKTTKKVQVLFCMPKDARTWFQANQQAQILIREYFGGDCELPAYSVTLWESN
jgi:hypothetical protein